MSTLIIALAALALYTLSCAFAVAVVRGGTEPQPEPLPEPQPETDPVAERVTRPRA